MPFGQSGFKMLPYLNSMMNLYRHINTINCEAIDVVFAGQLVPRKWSAVAGVGRQKVRGCLRGSRG
jgi:hypothetical protein